MKQAILIQADSSQQKVRPKKGKTFSLKELQGYVGGLIQIVPLPSGQVLICNDEGKLKGLPINRIATELWKKEYPIEQYPLNNDELIVGDVVVSPPVLVG